MLSIFIFIINFIHSFLASTLTLDDQICFNVQVIIQKCNPPGAPLGIISANSTVFFGPRELFRRQVMPELADQIVALRISKDQIFQR